MTTNKLKLLNPSDVEDQDSVNKIDDDDIPLQEEFSMKTKRKKKTEAEKLKIDMKGWNFLAKTEA